LIKRNHKIYKEKQMSFRKISIAISSIVLLISLEACHTTKNALVTEPKSNADTNKKEVLHAEDFLSKQISWNTFNGKAGMHFEKGDKSQDLTCNLKMKKDKEIWASLIALGILEAARAKITPDSLQAIYKIDKTAYVLSYKEGQELIGAQVEFPVLQRLFIGNPLIGADVKVAKFDVMDTTVQITQVQDDFTQVLTYNKKNWTLMQLQLTSKEKDFDCNISYGNYSAITLQQPFAFERHVIIRNKGQEIKLDMDFSKAELDVPVETNFSIPSSYERADIPKKK
jgi:hypothetical protein